MLIEELRDAGRTGVRLVFADHGPGIADVALAMRAGYTKGGGLGLGLGGPRTLADDFAIDSRPEVGTTVAIIKWGSV